MLVSPSRQYPDIPGISVTGIVRHCCLSIKTRGLFARADADSWLECACSISAATSIQAYRLTKGKYFLYTLSMSPQELRNIREETGWTQKRLSEILGITTRHVRNYETGVTPIEGLAEYAIRCAYANYRRGSAWRKPKTSTSG